MSEGNQKILFPELHGTGRFEKIGLSFPELLGSFVGFFEVLCGVLILLGLFTRLAAILTLIIMLVAIVTTKSMIYLKPGFWELLHGSRTDWSMLLGSLFLIFKGSPAFSLDSFVLH